MKNIFIASLIFCLHIACATLTYADAADDPARFIFAGHIRGGETCKINGLLPSFCNEAKDLKKDFVFIGGDMIFGYKNSYDRAGLQKEWQLVDSYLSAIDAPVYRVPGNHDWNSLKSKEIYNERYGREYYSFKDKDLLVIAINTSNLYPDTSIDWANKGAQAPGDLSKEDILKEDQAAFLKNEVLKADDDTVNYIVIFMANQLWQSEFWQTKIHPFLRQHPKVKLVISGDAMSGKFSTSEKDAIIYTNCGWAIRDDDTFSKDVFYLHVIFNKSRIKPDIYLRYVNMTGENISDIISRGQGKSGIISRVKERMRRILARYNKK